MNFNEFREFGKEAIDFIANYYQTIRTRNVIPSIEPGYLQHLLPTTPPLHAESWTKIMDDMNTCIMPGVVHWQSPNFHGFYPTGASFPSLIGDLLANSLGMVQLNWIASPVCIELEAIVMDWLAKMLHLPEEFLNGSKGPGGGILQATATEAILVCMLAARNKSTKNYLKSNFQLDEDEVKCRLVGYSSDQCNSSIEKTGYSSSIKIRLLPSNKDGQLIPKILKQTIENDKEAGLIPCFLVATLGTTPTCAFDNLESLGRICKQENIWMHVDAAYAGMAFVCPEYRHLMKGIEYCESFNINIYKWMLTSFDCSGLWVKNSEHLIDTFKVDRIYIRNQKNSMPEYTNWQINLGRKFKSLKIWFVLKSYGIEGIQKYIRKHISLAKSFEILVQADSRMETLPSNMGLVCFRIKGDCNMTQRLYENISASRKLFMTPCIFMEKYYLRFTIVSEYTEKEDIDYAWNLIQMAVKNILIKYESSINNDRKEDRSKL